ncbi:hypothetical protein [uncultured Treponema sp.]|uniref:hypothetical protein n=1 Tax=uncultured Treponema sp. TaxID=162155 RepID=UPI0025D54C47|nr:hypothetical protein [uncultured Treponema sp.]
MKNGEFVIKQKTRISNLAFLSKHTGEPYLYDLPMWDGVNHNSVFVFLQKDDVRAFLSANGISAPILDRITEEDLRDEKIHRKLAIMEKQDEFIKEKILCPIFTSPVIHNLFQHPNEEIPNHDILHLKNSAVQGNFLSLRNPFDIQHLTGQMAELQGELYEVRKGQFVMYIYFL